MKSNSTFGISFMVEPQTAVDGFARDLPIVEVNRPLLEYLIIFVSLAEDHNDIARICDLHRPIDRRPTVDNNLISLIADRLFDPDFDLIEDR